MSTATARLAKQLGTDRYTARRLLRAVQGRRPRVWVMPLIAAGLIVIVLAPLIGGFAGALTMLIAPPLGGIFGAVFGWAATVWLAYYLFEHARAEAALHLIRASCRRYECPFCGYDLRPGLRDRAQPICPECGESSPVDFISSEDGSAG